MIEKTPSLLTYSICLTGLAQERVIVIGGGEIAQRKVEALLEAGSTPLVISPTLTVIMQEWAAKGRIIWQPRSYQSGDLAGAFLVIAATNLSEINRAVWEEAQQVGCLINVVDDPVHSNFIVPAVLHCGPISVAISTGGSSPALARYLREQLQAFLPPELGILAEILAELRPEMQARLKPEERLQRARQVIESDILTVIKQEGRQAAVQYARKIMELPDD